MQASKSGRVKSDVMDKVSSKLYPKDNPDDASSRAAPDHPVLPHIMAAGSYMQNKENRGFIHYIITTSKLFMNTHSKDKSISEITKSN